MPLASTRSRRANGSLHLGRVDQRTAEARRWRDIHSAIISALGDPPKLTEPQRQLVRRAASMALLAEQREAAIVRGEVVDPTDYARLTGALSRVMVKLGLETEPHDDPANRSPLSDMIA